MNPIYLFFPIDIHSLLSDQGLVSGENILQLHDFFSLWSMLIKVHLFVNQWAFLKDVGKQISLERPDFRL
jgi:hypothetical protein